MSVSFFTKRFICGTFVAAIAIGCSRPNRQVTFAMPSHSNSSILAGEIKIAFNDEDERIELAISNGTLLQNVKADSSYPTKTHCRANLQLTDAQKSRSIAGYEIQAPAVGSPDGRQFAARYTARNTDKKLHNKLILIDQMNGKQKIIWEGNKSIECLAWRSDSEYLMLIDAEITRFVASPKWFVAAALSHPGDLYVYNLTIFDRSGQFLFSQQIARDVASTWIEASWKAVEKLRAQ